MIASFIIGIIIFGYAGWTIYRHVQKSKEGKCGACELKNNCKSGCDISALQSNSKNHFESLNK
ncbi:FeoB-associated Cys-rich membrane protein [Rummeliibacillus pycnus]|uniref:FeoB-associated Cys-rich membrane protein n=1 Tax=Rummeliibacillus pycnus TaxID=101070 RepID=UPI0037C8A67D